MAILAGCSSSITFDDLEPLLVQEWNLPAGVTGSQTLVDAPQMFEDVPPATIKIFRVFEKDNERNGGIAVFVYDDAETARNAYDIIFDGMGPFTTASDIGEKSSISTLPPALPLSSDVLWGNCTYVAHVRIPASADDAYGYAKRVEARLTKEVCP